MVIKQDTSEEPKTTRLELAELKTTTTEQMGPKIPTVEQMTTRVELMMLKTTKVEQMIHHSRTEVTEDPQGRAEGH